MSSLVLCVTERHDLPLVAVAAVICALGVWTAFALAQEAFKAPDRKQRVGWGLASAFCATSAIWATHFIAMIAFDPGLPYRFETVATVLSFFVALMLVGAAMCVMLAVPGVWGRLAGGAVGGLAISAMHYTGMSAFRIQGAVNWDHGAVAASVVAGLGLATLSALMTLHRRSWVRAAAPIALILAVCLDHFIAMSAVGVVFDPEAAAPIGGIHLPALAAIVAAVALCILVLSIAAVWLRTRELRQLLAEEARMRDLADVSIEGMLICEADKVVGSNESVEAMLGAGRDQLRGRAIETLLPGYAPLAHMASGEVDATLRSGDGADIPVKVISKPIRIAGRTRTVVAVRDQRERISTEAAMRRLAHEDTLTGLANRFSFNSELSARFASRRGGERSFALLMLDLDRFKIVNDSLGHGVGDELLRRAARRLVKAIRPGDLLARLGGDEFAIVLAGCAEPADVTAVAERIIELVARPFIIEGGVVEIGVSLGIAFAPADGETTAALSRSADLALYRAKEEGRGAYRFFEEEMNARMQARRTFEHDLRRAIARQEIFVVYQPQVDSATGRYDGAEALARWAHPERGVVSPADFIPLAEELGLITALGEFVLRKACAEAVGWPAHMTVSVNLSPMQLRDPRLAATVAGVLAETGLPGARLELELTENALLQDDGRAVAVLHALRDLGVRISMDDFGTGYSSISYLRRFPFDKIKIDQSFVRQLPHDPDSTAIVQAVASLGVQLGMKVTAEGVETEAQKLYTAARGCSQLQGYLFSKPVDAASAAALFNKDEASASAAA
jgi:diguanylate cyclase (GGDEF)-like protein